MNKTYIKIFAVGFALLGAWTFLDAVILLTTTSEYISIPCGYDIYGRLLYEEIYNPAYPVAYFDITIGFVELIFGILIWSLSKEKPKNEIAHVNNKETQSK